MINILILNIMQLNELNNNKMINIFKYKLDYKYKMNKILLSNIDKEKYIIIIL